MLCLVTASCMSWIKPCLLVQSFWGLSKDLYVKMLCLLTASCVLWMKPCLLLHRFWWLGRHLMSKCCMLLLQLVWCERNHVYWSEFSRTGEASAVYCVLWMKPYPLEGSFLWLGNCLSVDEEPFCSCLLKHRQSSLPYTGLASVANQCASTDIFSKVVYILTHSQSVLWNSSLSWHQQTAGKKSM